MTPSPKQVRVDLSYDDEQASSNSDGDVAPRTPRHEHNSDRAALTWEGFFSVAAADAPMNAHN